MFKVGDICIGQNFVYATQYNGMECEIVGAPYIGPCVGAVTGEYYPPALLYPVLWADGDVSVQMAHELRLRKPPSEFKGEQIIKSLFTDTPIKELA